MRDEEPVLADHLGQKHTRILTDSIGDQVIVESFLGVARPAHQPPHIARRERVGMLGTEIAGRIKRAVGDHHLYRHTAARNRRAEFGRVLHADAGTAGENARAARRSPVRDAQLRVLAIGHDVLGIEFSIGHHLRERHHRRRVRPDRIGRNHIHVGILGGLRRRDAAVYPDRLLFFTFSNRRYHGLLHTVRLTANAAIYGYSGTTIDPYAVSGFQPDLT